jgi:hypothetical protein
MLDAAIKFCGENGVLYPKVLLLRLKQLQRGDWPAEESSPETEPTPLNAWGVDITDDDIPF